MDQLSEVHRPAPQGGWPDYRDAFYSFVATTPDALALVCTHQPPNLFNIPSLPLDDDVYQQKPYLRWSYRSVSEGVSRVIKAWQSLGVQEGATLITFVPNTAEFVISAWAAVVFGLNLMPISPRNLTNREEAVHMVKTGLKISNGSRNIVIAGDEDLAKAVDELGILADDVKILAKGSTSSNGWTSFENLMAQAPPMDSQVRGNGAPPSHNRSGGTILFTSGTTSLPKGIFHPYHKNMGQAFLVSQGTVGSFTAGARICSNLPNNHAMGWVCLAGAFMSGAAIIYPGSAFDANSTLDTYYRERISATILVPTMIHGLVAAKAASPKYVDTSPEHLDTIMFGGSALSVDVCKMAIEDLGAKGLVNFYGCTEGHLTNTLRVSNHEQLEIAHERELSVGWPVPGYGAKIVDPDTGKTVPCNVLGEVHACGRSIIWPYIGGVSSDSWYTDEKGILWYKTGDQGRMDDQGRMSITGRYKEMIIRGGENISPAAVEAVLGKNVLLAPLIPLIVGVKDSIAGELPVAVIKGKVTPSIRDTIQTEIVRHMGKLYVPEDVISIQELGLNDYPRTNSGKVKKIQLTALVGEYLSSPANSSGQMESGVQLAEEVRRIWARAVGLDPSHIRLDAPIGEFADSITVMRVRDKIKRELGRVLSLAEMASADTIEKQVGILKSMERPASEQGQQSRAKRNHARGPPEAEDMVHLTEDPGLFEPTKDLVLKSISSHGFGWDDVEEIMPAYDFGVIMAQTGLYDSWSLSFVAQPTRKLDKAQLRKVFEAVVTNNRILASFLVWDRATLGSDVTLHVVMKQSPSFFDLVVQDGGKVATTAELQNLAHTQPHANYDSYPGPMYRALLVDVEETAGAAMVISVNHSVVDASMAQMIHEDLDLALAIVRPNMTASTILSQLQSHVDYKPWADSYFSLRTSIMAKASTKWHVRRLSCLREHVEAGAMFPATCQMNGGAHAATCAKGLEPVSLAFEVAEIHSLRKKYPHLTATIVLKAAVALMNVRQTGHTHAVFGNLEAARRYFPFLPKAMMDQAAGSAQFEATDVSGPAFQMVFNVVKVDRSGAQTVVGFLEQMQEEQTALTKHAAAPLKEIIRGLDEESPGAGSLLPRVIATQHFNWVPGLGTTGTNPFQQMQMLETVVRPTTGLSIHAGLGGAQTQTVFVNLYGDGESIGAAEVARVGAEIEAITKWLVRTDNWAAPVAGFEGSLESA